MTHTFPYAFEPEESGGVLVQLVDLPEAHTYRRDRSGCRRARPRPPDRGARRLHQAGAENPPPSPARGRPVAILPPLVAAKLALYEAMRAQGITRTALARQLGLQENGVRRLLDLDHRSHIDQIDRALAGLGKRLEVRVRYDPLRSQKVPDTFSPRSHSGS